MCDYAIDKENKFSSFRKFVEKRILLEFIKVTLLPNLNIHFYLNKHWLEKLFKYTNAPGTFEQCAKSNMVKLSTFEKPASLI